MRRLIPLAVIVGLAAAAHFSLGGNTVIATGALTKCTTAVGGGLSGTCTASSPITLLSTCSPNQILKWSGSVWACAPDGDSGITVDVTGLASSVSGGILFTNALNNLVTASVNFTWGVAGGVFKANNLNSPMLFLENSNPLGQTGIDFEDNTGLDQGGIGYGNGSDNGYPHFRNNMFVRVDNATSPSTKQLLIGDNAGIAVRVHPTSGFGGVSLTDSALGVSALNEASVRYSVSSGKLEQSLNGAPWVTLGTGASSATMQALTCSTGLSCTATNPITTTGTITLANTAVTPGSYAYSGFTVDQQGRLTAASDGATPALAATTISAGTGLSGGGDLSTNRTLTVNIAGGTCGAGSAATALSSTGTLTCGTVGGRGLYNEILSVVPTQSSTGLNSWGHQPTSATVTDGAQGITVYSPTQSSTVNVAVIEKAAPATPYTIKVLLSFTGKPASDACITFGWGQTSTGKGTSFLWEPMGNQNSLRVAHDNSYTSNASIAYSQQYAMGPVLWAKLTNDGTTVKIWISGSGDDADWYSIWSDTVIGSFLGAGNFNRIKFGVSAYSGDAYGKLMSYTETSP